LVGTVSMFTAKSSIQSRVLNTELPNTLQKISEQIDHEIFVMQVIARQVATDAHILKWNSDGQYKTKESLLVKKLSDIASLNNFSNVSIADKQTANYWNQEGFLRTLQRDDADGWFLVTQIVSRKVWSAFIAILTMGKLIYLLIISNLMVEDYQVLLNLLMLWLNDLIH
jgi:hypothetical protein